MTATRTDTASSASRQHRIDTGHYLRTDGSCRCDNVAAPRRTADVFPEEGGFCIVLAAGGKTIRTERTSSRPHAERVATAWIDRGPLG